MMFDGALITCCNRKELHCQRIVKRPLRIWLLCWNM